MPRTHRRVIAVLTVAVAGALLLWYSFNTAAGWFLERAAERAGIQDAVFDVKRLGLSRIILSHARFTVQTDSDMTGVTLDDASVRFAFTEPYLRAIDAHAARAHWRPRETAAASAPIGPLVLPLEHLAVRQFELVMDTTLGRSWWRGSLDAQREPDGSAHARFDDASHTLELKLPPPGTQAAIRLLRSPDVELLVSELTDLDRERFRVTARFDPIGMVGWLSESSAAPEDMRKSPLLKSARDIHWPQDRAVVDLTAVATADGDLVEADAVLSLANRRLLTAGARSARNGALSIEAKGEMKASDAFAIFKPLLPADFRALQIDRGTIRASGRLRQQKDQWSATAEMTFADASGAFEKISFTGVSGVAKLDPAMPFGSSLTANAVGVLLGGAIELRDLRLIADYRDGTLRVTEAVADSLGGRIGLKPANFDLAHPPYDITLSAEHVEFGEILALFQRSDLSGSGLLDAQLPLRVAADRLEVQGGTVHGTAPGTLRYAVPNPDNIAFRALSDFQYRSLDATLNYDQDGEYRVHTRVVGRNPQLFEGYPVALNLDISGRLPRLLAAGLLSGDFSGHVLKEVTGNGPGNAARPEQAPAPATMP